MPSVGMVSSTLERLAEQLQNVDSTLSTELLDPAKGHDWGFYDLRSMEASRFQLLYPAMERVFDARIQDDPLQFRHLETYYFSMGLLSLFKALLRTDPRAGQDLTLTGSILITDHVQWVAPTWIYDLLLENVAAYVRVAGHCLMLLFPVYEQYMAAWTQFAFAEKPLWECLLAARASQGRSVWDMRPIATEQFHVLLSAAKFILTDYEKTPRGTHAPAIMTELIPQLNSFMTLLAGDQRASRGA
jgi:hypothetical protein